MPLDENILVYLTWKNSLPELANLKLVVLLRSQYGKGSKCFWLETKKIQVCSKWKRSSNKNFHRKKKMHEVLSHRKSNYQDCGFTILLVEPISET